MICQECHVGRLQSARAPYVAWLEGRMMVMPGVPAWLCDACGHLAYDFDFVHDLNLLLEDGQGSEDGAGRRPPLSPPRQDWPRLRRSFQQ